MASPPQIPTPETRVGRYHLREKIGQTAAADLFRAVLPGLGGFEKRVVLKQLRPDLQTVPEHEARFVAQAKRAAAAHHPHLVQTFELLRDPVTRCMFAVMEDVEGPSLAELLDRTKAPLPAPVAVWVAASILDALAHLDEVAPASELGRSEVSPEQVRLSWRGDVKLGDYGLASEPDGLHLRGRTAYMSPEHLAGLPRDSRSEVFSVGAVLWEMLTGRRLFAAATLGRTTDLIRGGARPPVRFENPDVPEILDLVLTRALQPRADRRYRDVAQFRDDLRGILTALVPARGDTDVRTWLGQVVTLACAPAPQDASTRAVPPTARVEASVSTPQGVSARAVPPTARVEAAPKIPMPGGPANIETHEIVRSDGAWKVVPVGGAERLWVRGGRTTWGPFALGPTLTRLERVPVGALGRVELSVDGRRWVLLSLILKSLGLRLLGEDAGVPDAWQVGRLPDTSLPALLGKLEAAKATGRLIVVHEGAHGTERREILVSDGKLVALHSNGTALRTAVLELLGQDADTTSDIHAEQQLTDMFAWTAGRAYFDDTYTPERSTGRPLTWRLPRRLTRVLPEERLGHALAPHVGRGLERRLGFADQVERMGLLGWELTAAEAFGHGRTLDASLRQLGTDARAHHFGLAFAHTMLELGLLAPTGS